MFQTQSIDENTKRCPAYCPFLTIALQPAITHTKWICLLLRKEVSYKLRESAHLRCYEYRVEETHYDNTKI